MVDKKIEELQKEDPIKNNNIKQRYEDWIKQISPKNKELFKKIFCDISYFSESKLRTSLQKIFASINNKKNFLDSTLILVIESQCSKFNSSFYMTSFLVESNNISKNFCTLENYRTNQYSNSNFILCDDFIGSGKTFIDFISKNIEIFSNKHIYLLCIHIMNEGYNNIVQFAKKHRLKITISNISNANKYLSQSNPDLLNNYLDECNNLKITEPLGFENTEAIITTYRNTPNNTLGAIWQNTDANKAIFPRNCPTTPKCRQMNKEKKLRRQERYINGEKN